MADNPYVNRVEFRGHTLMDVSDTTAEAGDVVSGKVFYTAAGAKMVGTLSDATPSTSGLMSATDKTKLNGIKSGAEVNVQANWDETDDTSDAFIRNKPPLGTAAAKNAPSRGNASSEQVVLGSDSRLTDSRPASDVYSWAKSASKPTYTASEVGLGNVPNVPTNDQAPTYTEATNLTALSSGEKLSVALGKVKKAVNALISHLADTTKHITASERTEWSGKPDLTSSTTPLMDGTAAVGTSAYAARADHVHPRVSPNALRNWYFRNPVNQRGRGTGSANKVSSTDTDNFIIDGWRVTSGYAYITANGIYLNGTMAQTLEFPLTGTVKASALATSGTVTPTYNNGVFTITASGKTMVAAKLEPGSTQTLYSGTTLMDAPPDFALELARCQRYYETGIWFVERANQSGELNITVPFKVTKRTDGRVLTVKDANGNIGQATVYTGSWSTAVPNLHQNETPNGGAYGARISVSGLIANALVMGALTADAEL